MSWYASLHPLCCCCWVVCNSTCKDTCGLKDPLLSFTLPCRPACIFGCRKGRGRSPSSWPPLESWRSRFTGKHVRVLLPGWVWMLGWYDCLTFEPVRLHLNT